jgi:hypothetical protein
MVIFSLKKIDGELIIIDGNYYYCGYGRRGRIYICCCDGREEFGGGRGQRCMHMLATSGPVVDQPPVPSPARRPSTSSIVLAPLEQNVTTPPPSAGS